MSFNTVMAALAWFFIAFSATSLFLSLILCGLSVIALRREYRWMLGFENRIKERWAVLPSISVVIPAFNEEDSIVASIKSVLKSRYPHLEVIVVNDGSADQTLVRVCESFGLHSAKLLPSAGLSSEPVLSLFRNAAGSIVLVDKHNGGKADALNAGINLARSPLVCVVDADTVLERDTLLHLAEPFFDSPTMLVSGGFIRLRRPAHFGITSSLLYWLQELEYARSYGCFRAGLNVIHANVIISGALGLFRRAAVLEVGGYDPLAVGEDMELVLRLHEHYMRQRRPYAIAQIGFAVCRAAACDSLDLLGRQRMRWQRAFLSSLRAYRSMLFSPRAGVVGMVALPYLAIFDGIGPIVEVLGLLYLAVATLAGVLPTSFLVMFLSTFFIGSLNNFLCLAVDNAYLGRQSTLRARATMWLMGLTEPFWYHWVNHWWRLRGTYTYMTTVQTRTAWSMRKKI